MKRLAALAARLASAPYLCVLLAMAAGLLVAGWRMGWRDLWLSPDQRGRLLLRENRPADAAAAFRDPFWRGVALYRSGDFKGAAQAFATPQTPESFFNRGDAQVLLGQYDDAVKSFDRALGLRPDWPEARRNRDIALARAALRKTEGGEMDQTDSKPDEIVYDKNRKGGEETPAEPGQQMSDQAVQALWLKRVQTRPADFLRARFAWQLSERNENGAADGGAK